MREGVAVTQALGDDEVARGSSEIRNERCSGNSSGTRSIANRITGSIRARLEQADLVVVAKNSPNAR
jgi:hypothetical protein